MLLRLPAPLHLPLFERTSWGSSARPVKDAASDTLARTSSGGCDEREKKRHARLSLGCIPGRLSFSLRWGYLRWCETCRVFFLSGICWFQLTKRLHKADNGLRWDRVWQRSGTVVWWGLALGKKKRNRLEQYASILALLSKVLYYPKKVS